MLKLAKAYFKSGFCWLYNYNNNNALQSLLYLSCIWVNGKRDIVFPYKPILTKRLCKHSNIAFFFVVFVFARSRQDGLTSNSDGLILKYLYILFSNNFCKFDISFVIRYRFLLILGVFVLVGFFLFSMSCYLPLVVFLPSSGGFDSKSKILNT